MASSIYDYANKLPVDPTTGCLETDQQCQQTFYLKQQSETLKQLPTATTQDNTELQTQVQSLKQEVQTLKQQTNQIQQSPANPSNIFSGTFIAILLVSVIMALTIGILLGRKVLR